MTAQSGVLAPTFRRSGLRLVGLLVAGVCVAAPALPLGPAFEQPPIPLAALWAAYGWASDGHVGWRAPVMLAALGLAQDQLAGGPLGLYALIFVLAYFIGGFAATMMRTANLLSPWVGFGATAFAACIAAALAAQLALGGGGGVAAARSFAAAALVTTLLFPLVRPLYMGKELMTGGRV